MSSHPFADSGEWPATTNVTGLDYRVSDPDGWLAPEPQTPAWFETASEWSPAPVAKPQAPMTPEPDSDINLVGILLVLAFVAGMVAHTSVAW